VIPPSLSRWLIASRLSSAEASIVFTPGHSRMRWRTAGLEATASLTRSSMNRAFGKYRLASTRNETNLGIGHHGVARYVAEMCSSGNLAHDATCGRDVAYRWRKIESPTPTTRPTSTPRTSVTSIVEAIAAKSVLEKSKMRLRAPRSTSDNTATMIVAASVALGRKNSSGVRNSVTSAMRPP